MPKQDNTQVGFSGFQRTKESAKPKYATQVSLLDIGDFVSTLVKSVDISSDTIMAKYKMNGDPPPALIMKLDPEGFEYVMIRDLVMNGLLCHFSMITAEWHHDKGMCSVSNCKRFVQDLHGTVSLLREDPACRFRGFSTLDDESYDVGY